MKPRLLIGSSVEGLAIANAIQQNLDHDADCTVWTQGVFGPSSYPMDALLRAVDENDFGIFVFSPDDIVQMRTKLVVAARDNVVIESGMFIGRYGKDRNFIVAPRGVADLHIPTDLIGISLVDFDPLRLQANPQAALGAASTAILRAAKAHPVLSMQLTLAPRVDRGGPNFPLKLWIDIRNATTSAVVLTSHFFELNHSLRADNNAKGNPASHRFEMKFPIRGASSFDQFQALLNPNDTVATWLPLDSSHSDNEIRAAIAGANCGRWHYTCDWLGPRPWRRTYIEAV